MAATGSYRKVQYDVRPAKQVERRMLFDAFQLLAIDGFPIRSYQYTGMGSIFFYDYVMFHKLLGIEHMLSAEFDTTIERRVRFNVPFEHVQVRMASIGSVIPSLSRDRRHILWLDYDDVLRDFHLTDLMDAVSHLSAGSILLITLDAEPPGGRGSVPKDSLSHYQDVASDYLDPKPRLSDFSAASIPKTLGSIIQRVISRGLAGRPDARFSQLFNFLYADGHKMVTLGGMITTDNERGKLERGMLARAPYVRSDWAVGPLELRIPTLTKKERHHLDAQMPRKGNWKPKEFELQDDDVAAYAMIYRFLPAYGELLV